MEAQQQQPRPKPTAGRKRLTSRETVFIGYKAGIETKERIISAADRLGLNNSDVIRIAVEQWLTKFEKSN